MSVKKCAPAQDIFERLVDETKTTVDEQIDAIAERYMGINCACFTPNSARIDDIVRLAKEYKVDGVIDVNLKFCSLYDVEGYTVEKSAEGSRDSGTWN